jgi:hypothetical protein
VVVDSALRPGVEPEGWSARKLFQKHSSRPFNPAIAGTFFWAGAILIRRAGLTSAFCTATWSPIPTSAFARCSPSRRMMSRPSSSEYGGRAIAAVVRFPLISITSPSAAGHFLAHSTASSFDYTSMIQ